MMREEKSVEKPNKNKWTKIWALGATLVLCFLIFAAAAPTSQVLSRIPVGFSGETSTTGKLYITIQVPSGWHRDHVKIIIKVDDPGGVGIGKIEAKSVQNGSWNDITDHSYLDISDNSTVYVQVTDRNGRLLRIEAIDDRSGVAAIYLDGEKYIDLQNGTIEIRLDTKNTTEEKLYIQAVDGAGNLSAVYQMRQIPTTKKIAPLVAHLLVKKHKTRIVEIRPHPLCQAEMDQLRSHRQVVVVRLPPTEWLGFHRQ